MKKLINIFKKTLVVAVVGCSVVLTSCNDYLTVYPANSVIQENFWQTAEDVKGIVATSYLQLANEGSIMRMILWGELRADNVNVREGKDKKYMDIVDLNIKPSNEFCTWNSFYSAINYANLVLEFAPLAVERDPNFTEGDMEILRGEMYAMRALAHFYLLRTFRDIPLSRKASLNDSELPEYPQVHPMVALDSIMSDLDMAEKLTMEGEYPQASYGSENNNYNNGRLNRDAVYALKADVNLWRAAFAKYYLENGMESNGGALAMLADEFNSDELPGEGGDSELPGEDTPEDTPDTDTPADTPEDIPESEVITILNPDEYYRMAIENCDSVIARMNRSMEKYYKNMGITNIDFIKSENPYFLTEEYNSSMSSSAIKSSVSYNYLFGTLKDLSSKIDRHEIIFELKFNNNNKNTAISALYGKSGDIGGVLHVADNYVRSATSKYHKNDYRYYAFTRAEDLTGSSLSGNLGSANTMNPSGKITIAKYAAGTSPGYSGSTRTSEDANWIIYRKTDVMLMKAEALAQLSAVNDQQMYDAFQLVKAVNDRSMMLEKDSLTQPRNIEALQEMVRDERVRELAFEGKRWYDLVRVALRDGSTAPILFVTDKLGGSAGTAARKKMQTINSLFFPIAESELNANPLLIQNPVYEESESSELN